MFNNIDFYFDEQGVEFILHTYNHTCIQIKCIILGSGSANYNYHRKKTGIVRSYSLCDARWSIKWVSIPYFQTSFLVTVMPTELRELEC